MIKLFGKGKKIKLILKVYEKYLKIKLKVKKRRKWLKAKKNEFAVIEDKNY